MTTPFNILTSPIAPGTTLVEAGAGTGKTYALTRMVLRLLLEGVGAAGGLRRRPRVHGSARDTRRPEPS
jgi:ATP-dependent exoDNAse (exonuclease V) beta subunit